MKLFLLLLLSPLTLLPSAHAASTTEQAQAAWQNRATSGQTEQAILLWEKALKEEPQKTELLIRLSQACGRVVRQSTNDAEKEKWAERAKTYGKEAIEKNPQSAEAHAAYAEAIGQWTELNKGVRSLKNVRLAVDMLQKAIALDPKSGYAHMLLSSFYREAPGMLSVGDKKKALAEAKLAVECDPAVAINHLTLARAYLKNGMKDKAIESLKHVISMPVPAGFIPETQADKETAAKMLKELGIPVTSPPCEEASGSCTEQEGKK